MHRFQATRAARLEHRLASLTSWPSTKGTQQRLGISIIWGHTQNTGGEVPLTSAWELSLLLVIVHGGMGLSAKYEINIVSLSFWFD